MDRTEPLLLTLQAQSIMYRLSEGLSLDTFRETIREHFPIFKSLWDAQRPNSELYVAIDQDVENICFFYRLEDSILPGVPLEERDKVLVEAIVAVPKGKRYYCERLLRVRSFRCDDVTDGECDFYGDPLTWP